MPETRSSAYTRSLVRVLLSVSARVRTALGFGTEGQCSHCSKFKVNSNLWSKNNHTNLQNHLGLKGHTKLDLSVVCTHKIIAYLC